jgi:CRISPR/Cas system CSM-associated protein Csm3 (group 7 of RAMP superfamily)
VSPEGSEDEPAVGGATDGRGCARRAGDADRINNRRSFLRDGERTWIPASSIKGMVRAQAQRILLTCLEHGFPAADDAARERVAEAMLGELMGDTGCMSRLRLRPAEATFADEHVHAQMMNAIDRFSGAVAERRKTGTAGDDAPDTAGTLFCVEAVRPAEPYTLEAEVTAAAVAVPWMRGLLLLLLRDGMEGDLRIGWGRARGFGAVRVGVAVRLDEQTVLRNWREVMPALGPLGVAADAPGRWVDALHTQLRERMEAALEASR